MMGVVKRASGLQTALLLVLAECFVAFCHLWKKKKTCLFIIYFMYYYYLYYDYIFYLASLR